jgi:hypothetical protein
MEHRRKNRGKGQDVGHWTIDGERTLQETNKEESTLQEIPGSKPISIR